MLQIGQLVDNKYRILDIVGKGGMSVVYLARNERANKSWAVKEVRKSGVDNLEIKKNSLIAETEMLKKLSHPYLPTIVDVIETDETYLVVMDYIEGNDLGKIVEEQGAQPQENVIKWGKQLCDVLGYLHSREKPIIYRDLKPANIMLKPDGNITLIDFGTAREIRIADANDTISLGTRGYAAPEQFGVNAKTDARTDIYCLGATMYHLVTNHNPSTPPYVMLPIRQHNSSLSPGLEKIILKCTCPNPDDRYQSCEELMYALDNYEKIDDRYRKKQKKKIAFFFVALFMCILSVVFSGVSYNFAQNKKNSDIESYLEKVNDNNSSKKTKEDNCEKAIKLAPNKVEFYDKLLDLYLSYDDEGKEENDVMNTDTLSVEELGQIKKFELSTDNNLAPLEQLKDNNPSGYADFCKKMGIKCWYHLCGNNKETVAKEWFDKYKSALGNKKPDDYVEIYCNIAECSSSNRKYDREEEKVKGLQELWNLLEKLSSIPNNEKITKEDNILVDKEIYSKVDGNAQDFQYYGIVTQEKIESLLEKTRTDLINIANTVSKVPSIENLIRSSFSIGEKTDILVGINDDFDKVIDKVENAYSKR